MTSTTKTKKEIIDWFWKWSEERGDWAELLINKIVSTENELSNEIRQDIFNCFLQSINNRDNKSADSYINTNEPNYNILKNGRIELISLSGISGVNCLAGNQTIEFGKNLTLTFGGNGTGKTGYVRILKSLGLSYDTDKKILPNMFRENVIEGKKATIKYKCDGKEKDFIWDGKNKNQDLENISVFNSNCVKISLSDKREIIFLPSGLNLFALISSELDELKRLAKEKISKYDSSISSLTGSINAHLTEGTPQKKFISDLSASSTEEQLNKLAIFETEHEKDLESKESELSKLNNSLIQKEIQDIKTFIPELDDSISAVQGAKEWLDLDNNCSKLVKLISIKEQIEKLESETQKGIKEIVERNGVKYYEVPQFQSFIKSAEDYIKILDREYPVDGDICIYCSQPLNDTAKRLLKSYRDLLNSETQENLLKLKKQKSDIINEVTTKISEFYFRGSIFGTEENGKPKQPDEVINYNELIGVAKIMLKEFDNITDISSFKLKLDFDYDNVVNFLSAKKKNLDLMLNEKIELERNLLSEKNKLKTAIYELKSRKFLSEKTKEVKDIIANYEKKLVLEKSLKSFDTSQISREMTKVRESLISSNFKDKFKDELKKLKMDNKKVISEIDLSFETKKGSPKIKHNIKSRSLLDVLSEGEQKTIALSEFLAELQLDSLKAPVIFDDLVNSLDHDIIDYVAKRLLELSAERQVIIFTHSILLFNELFRLNNHPEFKHKHLDCKFYESKNEYEKIGIIEAREEINKIESCLSKIEGILNNLLKNRLNSEAKVSEADVAAEGYRYLRSAIELFVEWEVLNGTVKRYQKNISLTKFLNIKGELLDNCKCGINGIYEECCKYIHSSPEEVISVPTIEKLKSDFNHFKEIRSKFLEDNKEDK